MGGGERGEKEVQLGGYRVSVVGEEGSEMTTPRVVGRRRGILGKEW